MKYFIVRIRHYYLLNGYRYFYFLPLLIAAVTWMFAVNTMPVSHFYIKYWSSGLTMVFGSFFAGSTPLGGGAVAFPVFTKFLDIPVADARTFSLMIQSVGMTFATLFFMSKKIWIDWKLIFISLPGSMLGIYLGSEYLKIADDTVKFLFTEFIILTAFLYFFAKKLNSDIHVIVSKRHWLLVVANLFSFVGGLIVAKMGSGADVALFFLLVFLLGNSAKKATPTTVAFMAINSVITIVFVIPIHNVSEFVLGSWWICAPIVALGAPVGGWVLNRLSTKKFEMLFFLAFSCEILSSLIFASMPMVSRIIVFLSVLVFACVFSYREFEFRK